ncbi:hypothetical protein PMNALOAF_1827 [Methylobacterium adhaesivum]|uniref:Uncharacterized protein n=1 Tax=Methylobacterium adhaesivum TaxID=333297 RepID=A0ABT8BDD1_9HYPH|nr:hypothetical protein [Methylobacterium adhaesivum]MDN3589565.1 hypothetical protein [Methylobacterium adhaesivum]GJD30580.1 hypothetical protein PMNALOAF_1827 [Methylobacterium adhaesivum]
MAGRKLDPTDVPTLGPWQVGSEGEADAPPEPATNDDPSSPAYLIRQARPIEMGGIPIAHSIRRVADARLMAAAPDLADALVRLLTSHELNGQGIEPRTQRERDAAWVLLVRVAPHLEIGAWP